MCVGALFKFVSLFFLKICNIFLVCSVLKGGKHLLKICCSYAAKEGMVMFLIKILS